MAKKKSADVQNAVVYVETTPQEERKAMLVQALVQQEENEGGVEVEAPPAPTTVNAFSDTAVVSGPFARRRIGEKVVKAKSADNARRGIFKIWEDKTVKNIGDGTNTYDIPSKRV